MTDDIIYLMILHGDLARIQYYLQLYEVVRTFPPLLESPEVSMSDIDKMRDALENMPPLPVPDLIRPKVNELLVENFLKGVVVGGIAASALIAVVIISLIIRPIE